MSLPTCGTPKRSYCSDLQPRDLFGLLLNLAWMDNAALNILLGTCAFMPIECVGIVGSEAAMRSAL